MKIGKATLNLTGLVLLSLMFCTTMPAQQPPDNVAGNWTIYSTNIENGETVVKHVQITQSGNQLAGFFEGPNQSGPIQGEIHGNYIRFSTVTKNVLNFGGHVYGDRMSGSYGFRGKHAAWQAERTTPVGETASPVTGTVYAYQPVIAPPAPTPVPAPAPVSQYVAPQSTVSAPQDSPVPTPAPLSADQLDALVAPIALYPDALVAQVLAASTNPDQVADADTWLAQNTNLTGIALAQAVGQQSWDPSVKALTQFPSVLDNLAHNLSWTSSLGQAFASQQADVMTAVQTMRAKAQAAGTLQSTSQITVTQPSANTIVIQPANPQVVYVPQYNPAVVYGAPVAVPLYVPPAVPVASAGLYFGSGVAVGAVVAGGGWGGGWGWNAWNVNWGGWGGGGSAVIYNNNTYINNRTWNNTGYNGYHPWGPGNHPDPYRPGVDTHYGPNGAYHPNGYYGPNGGFHHDVPGTNPADQPNGGDNGDHGLIGGNGGVQHNPSGTVGPQVYKPAGRAGIPGSVPPEDGAPHPGDQRYPTAMERQQQHPRSPMTGNGNAARAEANRGHASMHSHPAPHPAMHHPTVHAAAPHGGGGARRR